MSFVRQENAALREQVDPKTPRVRGVLAILLGLLLVPVNVFILMYMEVGSNKGIPGSGAGPYPSTISLFANTILFLVVLTLLNSLLIRRLPRLALARGELLIVYVMLVISTAIVSIDYLDVLVPMMTFPFRFATPENKWAITVIPHIPSWISVSDPAAIKGWYEGGTTLYTWQHIRPWLVPVAAWSVVIFAMMWVMFCINAIVRQQWIAHDKLQFPVIELPMQLTDPDQHLLRSKLMWIGFGISGGICLMNGLSVLYPAVPYLNVRMTNLQPYLPNKPWNAIGWFPLSFYPYAIGLSFLLPVDMLFSCWFFFLSWKAIRVIASVYGLYDYTPNFPYQDEQSLGAYYFIGGFALWAGRKHLASVLRSALKGEKLSDEADGPMSYRTAVIGVVVGTAVVMEFVHLIGLDWWVAVVAVLLYFAMALAVSRMHAEFGPPSHGLHGMGPEMILTGALGTAMFSNANLTGLSWFWWFNRSYRSIPIAYQLDGLKMAERGGIAGRTMGTAIVLASIVATLSGFWIYLHLGYSRGASVGMAGHVAGFGWEAFAQHLTGWMTTKTEPNHTHTLAIGWGAAFAWMLYLMKLRVSWWPLHPLGFAVSTSYPIHTIWLPTMIAWAAKLITLRTGGLKSYRKALSFFLGLVLGDFIVGTMWPIVGWLFGVSTYSFMQ